MLRLWSRTIQKRFTHSLNGWLGKTISYNHPIRIHHRSIFNYFSHKNIHLDMGTNLMSEFNSFYCVECDWFNTTPGRLRTIPNSAAWHQNERHTIMILPGEISQKLWNKANFIEKLQFLMKGTQLEVKDEDDYECPVITKEPNNFCIHDWKVRYHDALFQLKTSSNEAAVFHCKKCRISKIQGPSDIMIPLILELDARRRGREIMETI